MGLAQDGCRSQGRHGRGERLLGHREKSGRKTQASNSTAVVDTGDHDWKSTLELPALIEFTGVTKFSLSFSAAGDEPFEPTGRPRPQASRALRRTRRAPSEQSATSSVRNGTLVRFQSNQVSIATFSSLRIPRNTSPAGDSTAPESRQMFALKTRVHFGYWPISKVSGFIDENTGAVTTRGPGTSTISQCSKSKGVGRGSINVADLAVTPGDHAFGRWITGAPKILFENSCLGAYCPYIESSAKLVSSQ